MDTTISRGHVTLRRKFILRAVGSRDEQEDEDERSVSSHVELCCGMGPPTVKLVTHVANFVDTPVVHMTIVA